MPGKDTKSPQMKITVFLCFLSAAGAMGDDPASQAPAAEASEPPAVRSVTPAEWLKAQPKPLFRPDGTLPRLTRYGWVLPTDARIELAENWGYALEFGGYLGEADAARVDDPKSDEAKLAALAKADPKRYPLVVICTRKLPGTEAPPETWTRDKDGKVLNGKAQSMDGTEWSEGKGAVFSPEAPDAVWKLAGEYRAGPLRELQKRGVPISIVLNGGEYGLGVLGFAQPVWSQDPRIVAAVKQTTNNSWRDYASARKGHAERLIADEVRTAVPQRQLYVYYTAGGRTLRNKDWAIDDWGPKWKHMRGVSDLPSNEVYYRHFNDGFTGRLNLLTIALNAVAAEIATGDSLSYNWICAGWPRGDEKKHIADLDRWTGFLKCYYTAGMLGGNVGYYDFPKGGFAAKFPTDAPPAWLRQMTASAHVHALFSQVEELVRQSDLLPGPMRHAISSADPAYEFPTGDDTTRVLGRKHRARAEWLLTAWASDGPERAAQVRVPELGRLTLRARPCGSVYRAVLKNGTVTLTQLDEEGSTFTKAPISQPVTAPADLTMDSVPAGKNLFAQKFSGQRNDFSGHVGFEFVPAAPLSVTALGRSVSGGALQKSHAVTLWDPLTEKPLASANVSPASKVDEHGFAFERLANPLMLAKGRSYRLTSGEEKGGDPMMDIGDIRAHLAVADVGPGVFAVGDAYPKQNFGRDEQGYGLPTLYFDTTGVAPGLLKVGPREPTPFLRVLQTGYLMNCTFRAIRPYM